MDKRLNDHTLYMRRWREQQGEKYRAYMKAWRAAHKAKISAYNKQYQKEHAVEHRAINKRWRENHPERQVALGKAGAAHQRYPGTLSLYDVMSVIEKSGRKCFWCGKEDLKGRDLTLEHLKPVNDVAKLVVACHSCNCKKLHRTYWPILG